MVSRFVLSKGGLLFSWDSLLEILQTNEMGLYLRRLNPPGPSLLEQVSSLLPLREDYRLTFLNL